MNNVDNKPVAVVVDGYSAGNFLPRRSGELDVHLVHVQGTPELIPTMQPPDLADYDENIVCVDEATVLEQLRALSPVCVIAGQESAVPMADRLSEALGLPSNGSRLSQARRDKYEMIETLRAAGLHCAAQFKTSDPAQAARWAEQECGLPVVVKPLSSAAADGVYICTSYEEVAAAAEKVLASQDIFGGRNTEVLLQSFLQGTEYVVDTVCSDGQRFVCGVWEYEKTLLPSGRRIYDKDILIAPDSAPAQQLIAYVDEVLTALNIRWGAAHAEVMLTPQGPALVEIGARVNGSFNPRFHDVCLGHNQNDLAVLSYMRPEQFQREYGDRIYPKAQPAIVYNVPMTLDGVVDSVDQSVVDRIQALPSTFLAAVKLKPGARIRSTVDLLTSPMRVFLTAPTEAQLMADYQEVRRLKDSVYRVR